MVKLQIGAGLDGPAHCLNRDASPTLWMQWLPGIGGPLQTVIRPRFSSRVAYGDVVRGLPLAPNSVQIVSSSHVLEHLVFEDLNTALKEIHRVLCPRGLFRNVLPHLDQAVQAYWQSEAGDRTSEFMRSTLLGVERRERGLVGAMRSWLGNSRRVWMWDYPSLASRLAEAGFMDIRAAIFGDSEEPAFVQVESAERWQGCLGFECRKPA